MKLGPTTWIYEKVLWHADELLPVLPPIHGLVALGGLVGEDGEGGGQEGADGARDSHPVGTSHLAVAKHKGVGVLTHFHNLKFDNVEM